MTRDGLCKRQACPANPLVGLGTTRRLRLYVLSTRPLRGARTLTGEPLSCRIMSMVEVQNPSPHHDFLNDSSACSAAKSPCDDHPRNGGAKPLVAATRAINVRGCIIRVISYSGTIGAAEKAVATSIAPLHKLGCRRRTIRTSMHSTPVLCFLNDFYQIIIPRQHTGTSKI